MFSLLYHQILYRPLVNLLIFFYQVIPYHDLGLAIILLTLLIRLLLYPFVAKSLKAQRALADLAPEIKAIQKQHKDNREEQTKRLMELYRERGVSPLSGCLPILIQLPLLIALYQVFAHVASLDFLPELYVITPHPDVLHPIAFHLINLSQPNIFLAILAGASQFLQGYLMPQAAATGSDAGFQKALQAQTVYFLPIFITIISLRFPAALALYWTVLNILGIFQQLLVAPPISAARIPPEHQ